MRGHARGRKRRKKCVMWRRNCWILTRNAPPKRASRLKDDCEQYQLFCDSFPFETTPDQVQAINAGLSEHVSAAGNGLSGVRRCRLGTEWRCAPLS
ncbi:hypothetical protein ACNKHR_00670 [Shigella flexneri]